MKRAILALEDGTIFEGESRGATGEVIGEIVFSTGMTGYQEDLTDPSFAGLILTLTFPLIGNYGVNAEDDETEKPFVKGFIIKELCDLPNNFRCEDTLEHYLIKNNIIAITGIDTRALTKKLRVGGTLNGMISTDPDFNFEKKKEEIKACRVGKVVEMVSCKEKRVEGDGKYRVAMLDLGLKRNIIRSLVERDCTVTVYPATTPAAEILAEKPDGIMLTNGPGDPKDCPDQIETVKKLLDSKIPLFGICLGHQLAALAAGGSTEKLKFGHRGANHPVKDLSIDRTYITSQNHGYAVLGDSLDKTVCEVSHINMNDGTVEGIRYLDRPAFTVQFHPEAAPGPKDTEYLFDRFIAMMGGKQ